MDEATSVEWIVTERLDALILENELIKENQPRYNMRLKDDKSFPYVAIDTRVDFPAPFITRPAPEGRAILRSFVDVRALRTTIDELLQAFPLRSCTRHKFNYQERINRPCLLYESASARGLRQGDRPEGYRTSSLPGRGSSRRRSSTSFVIAQRMTTAAQLKHYEAAAKAATPSKRWSGRE